MNQIECLTRSIEDKWIPIVEGRGPKFRNRDADCNCECCRMYYHKKNCIGCPIHDDTGESDCYGTPHGNWRDLGAMVFDFNNYDLMIEAKAAAQAELDYLIDLRDRLEAKDVKL